MSENKVLSREDILAMEPGAELDEIVAVEVMGFDRSRMRDGWIRIGALATYPKRYSADMSAAWDVLEKLRPRYGWYGVEMWRKGGYRCLILDGPEDKEGEAICNTAPEAICKAALLAVME